MQGAYYSGVNPDLLKTIPLTAQAVLEIGCGAGEFGRAFLARRPGARYYGVELFEQAGRQAAPHLTHTIVGDIEQPQALAALDKVRKDTLFDTLILGDVLEHLRDPWQVLAQLRERMQEGAMCLACIPNVAHWSVISQLLQGRWDYAGSGLLDKTHLRFFTLDTALELFRQAGWTPFDVLPRVLWPDKVEAALKPFLPLAETLGVAPSKLARDLAAFQWVVRAVNGRAPERLPIVGLGIQKTAGVTDARIDYPMAALASLPDTRMVWSSEDLVIPRDWPPGVFILHRQFMNDSAFNAQMEKLVARGWALVADMDDDPYRWEAYVETDFAAFRRVHAITVSTEPLARLIRQWNPHVQVFPNAMEKLPLIPSATPKQGRRLRIFFGALNREADWEPVSQGIFAAARQLGDTVEFVIVHDQSFYSALPDGMEKNFYPTLPHEQYMQVLGTCDLALLPLADTPFNRFKSDLKFIECCAAGVMPICSPVVYAERTEHRDIGFFAATPEEWRQQLLQACSAAGNLPARRAQALAYIQAKRMHCHQVAERLRWYRRIFASREVLESARRQRGPWK